MILAELRLANLHHLYVELIGLFLSALLPRVGMILAELRRTSLHRLHLEPLSLFPSAIKPAYALKDLFMLFT
ncbi:hypothetical protein N7448_010046 [Penicillium atrosanguineum]|nr:hypothetical protein N7526_009972 [Penicillium atrosanguineum]KAJ5119377.1 hypothetical protein N7448_010046 [Penicillium atrosanguineum]